MMKAESNQISWHLSPTTREKWCVRQGGLVTSSHRQPGSLQKAGASLFKGTVLCWFLDRAWAAPAVVLRGSQAHDTAAW